MTKSPSTQGPTMWVTRNGRTSSSSSKASRSGTSKPRPAPIITIQWFGESLIARTCFSLVGYLATRNLIDMG